MNNETELPPLPEPQFQLKWLPNSSTYHVTKPNVGNTDVFTADQMRDYARQAVAAAAVPDAGVQPAGWRDALSNIATWRRHMTTATDDFFALKKIAKDALATPPQPAAQAVEPKPIDMVLHCPACGMQHIDAPEDSECDGEAVQSLGCSNPPHRLHLCRGCGHIWRPANVPTNGVAAVATKGKADGPIITQAVEARAPKGWKLVPIEPTTKMIDMGRSLSSFPERVYRAMLNAAPNAGLSQRDGDVDG